jgi:predicted AAA+ superfamily ATPase
VKAIQVCHSLSQQGTVDREMGSLTACLTEIGLDEGFVLTRNEAGEKTYGGKRIRIIPVWKWAIENPPGLPKAASPASY